MRFLSNVVTRKRYLLGITLAVLVLVLAASISLSEITAAIAPRDTSASLEIRNTVTKQEIEEPANYSFASCQESSNIQVVPGEKAEGRILFYNVDGNRITHIKLEVANAPEGWEAEINPPLHEQYYDVDGEPITVEENFSSKPTNLSPEEITDIPQGMICLEIGNRGYALARPVTIAIKVPEFEATGTYSDITITATASWLGQNGAGIIKQTRDFDFTVTTCNM